VQAIFGSSAVLMSMAHINTAMPLGNHGLDEERDDGGKRTERGMLLAHKITLQPNYQQRTYFAKAAGTARFAYNWALKAWKTQYACHKQGPTQPRPNAFALRRALNTIKKEAFPWMAEVTKCAPQMAIIHLGDAYKHFFKGKESLPPAPQEGNRRPFHPDQRPVPGGGLTHPHPPSLARLGWVRMRERLRFSGHIQSATVSRVADRWFVSLTVQTNNLSHLPPAENQGVVGVDLGVNALATLSTGESSAGPRPHRALLNRQRRLARSLSRKHKGETLALSVRRWTCQQCGTSHDRDVNAAINSRRHCLVHASA